METKKKKKQQLEMQQIEEMSKEEAIEVTKEIAILMGENTKNFWEISKRLRDIREKRGYKKLGYETFEDYTTKVFEIISRTARAYIQAREYMEKWHAHATFDNIEPQKVLLLSRLDNEEYNNKREELDNKVFSKDGISWNDLNEEIRKITGKSEEWLRILDVWNFKENTGDGLSNLPPEILKNLIYYYTFKGELIYDCFAGSGQTYKIAKEMERECVCSDISPKEDFIMEWNVDKGFKKFPEDLTNTKLIFLDPPYWNMVDYGEGWSNTSIEEFYLKFDKLLKHLKEIVNKDTAIALIIMPLERDGVYYDLGFEMYKLFQDNGFIIDKRLCVPLSRNWSLDPRIQISKDNNEILVGSLRDLIIFKLK